MIKTVDFYGTQVTRLLLGDNPFNGHSYIPDVYNDDDMMDYYTAERCVKTLFQAEEYGINTYVALGSPFILRILRQYKNEGGKMHIIFQSYPAIDLEINIWQMMACKPIGIYHQGGTFDCLCEEGREEEIHRRLAMLRAAGVKVGLGTHVPETPLRAEREGWDVDFHTVCLYNARKTQRGQQSGFITGKPKQLIFYPEDRFEMFGTIKKASKPCIAFKIFAGGQLFYSEPGLDQAKAAENALKETYEQIKPGDMACVGIFQKEKNQLKENVEIVSKIL